MQIKWLISVVLGFTISIAALYLAFRNVPFSELGAYLVTINYFWIIPTILLVLATFLLRVWRWQLILGGARATDRLGSRQGGLTPSPRPLPSREGEKGLGHYRVGYWQAFHPLMIGFMMNCILPGRVGEIARPTILRQKQGVPLTTGLATVATERLFDIILLVLLFAWVFGAIARQPDLEVSFGSQKLNSDTLQSIAWTMIRLMLLICLGLVVIIVPWTRARLIQAITWTGRRLSALVPAVDAKIQRVTALLVGMIENITAGFDLIRHPSRLLGCAGLTAGIWALSLMVYYVFALGCPGISLSLKQWTTVMVVVCFFIALPSVPGFWGLWEAGGVFALSLFGIPEKEAVGFTLVNHAVQLMPVIVVGWISALITSVNIWRLFARKKKPGASEAPSPAPYPFNEGRISSFNIPKE